MAKRRVKISLATKFRLLFGLAVAGIIAVALIVPWYFMELLAEQGVAQPGSELTRMRLNEWTREHYSNPQAARDSGSKVVQLHMTGAEESTLRAGPEFVRLTPDLTAPETDMGPIRTKALKTFIQSRDQELAIIRTENDRGLEVYRCFRAVRIEDACMTCHGPTAEPRVQFQPGELVGLIDVTLPPSAASSSLVWWTRGVFLVGGILAAILAFIMFTTITQRLILRPVRKLRDVSDRAAEGDLSVRSSVTTGDELQRLGESFNDMLSAISEQTDKLRSANKALDLKLNELAEANITLFQANQVKSEFLGNISHELRTPLNSIIGFADLLAGKDDEKVSRYGSNIAIAAKNLLTMIEDMLHLAKIEAGKAEVSWDKVNVSDLCQLLTDLMKPQADKKRLELRTEIDEELPLITTDGSKLQQVLFNLLSNAIKYTPVDGEVKLSARVTSRSGEDNLPRQIAIAVSDTGPGIPESEQQMIFEKFYQIDRMLTKQSSGAGLGLAISRELITLIAGRLSLNSTPGHGAEFIVTLPVRPDVRQLAEKQQSPAGP
ncbi:MAG: ATP-binding protein [Phycisphaerae bacterium]